jgi:hypothetical protein
MRNYFVLATAAVALGACASGSNTAIQRLSADVASSARVTDVQVVSAPADVGPTFKGIMKAKLETTLAGCAVGGRPLRLEASIDHLKKANPAMTWLLADSNSISGSVKLVDPATNEVLGSYSINRSFAASGLIGVAMTSDPENQMSEAFSGEVCKAVFKATK